MKNLFSGLLGRKREPSLGDLLGKALEGVCQDCDDDHSVKPVSDIVFEPIKNLRRGDRVMLREDIAMPNLRFPRRGEIVTVYATGVFLSDREEGAKVTRDDFTVLFEENTKKGKYITEHAYDSRQFKRVEK